MEASRRHVVTHALGVEPLVHRVRPRWSGMKLRPDLTEPDVVLAPTERARTMPRREGRRLVEEEELREPPGLQKGLPPPPLELEPAGDPALHGVPASYAACSVV